MFEIDGRVVERIPPPLRVDGPECGNRFGPRQEDIGIDSLGLVESIFAIEETFDLTVPFNANDPQASDFDISSVAAIVAAVEKLKAEQQG